MQPDAWSILANLLYWLLLIIVTLAKVVSLAIVAFGLSRPATVRLEVVDKNAFVADLPGVSNPALMVETITDGKQRTAIRIGPAGLADGFRQLQATCPK